MARVIHRRKSPPYALIIFVFLFLIAASLAFIAFNKWQDKKAEADATEKVAVKLAGKKIAQGQYEHLKVGLAAQLYKKKGDRPVLAELVDREKKLREIISSKAATRDAAVEEVGTLRSDIDDHGPLIDVVRKFQRQLAERDKKIADLGKDLDQLEQKRKSSEEQANQLQEKIKAITVAKDGKIKDLDDALKAYQADQTRKLQDAQQKWDDDRTEKDKEIAKLSGQVAELLKDNRELKLRVANLQEKTKPRPAMPKIVSLALQPDGRILRVLQGEDVCYINIGTKDRVLPGLTFSVYPAGKGPHTDTAPKGSITVLSVVGSALSECRIDKTVDPERPIVASDNIANVAFDATRTYTFVVEGRFDLYGASRPSVLSGKQVKALIQKFRGVVAEQLTPQTDFVVMGTAPAQPTKPKDDAEDSEKVVYEEQMKVYKRYTQVRDAAVRMRIPVLNANRFLALVGYTPQRTLK